MRDGKLTSHYSRTYIEAASGRERLLYRVWLSVPNNRALPAGHEVLWGRIEAGELRSGIRPA